MSLLLAVDPGIRGCGVAVFAAGKLSRAAYVKNVASGNTAGAAATMAACVVDWLSLSEAPDDVILEWPRVYASRIREGRSPGDPNDLLALAGVDSAIAALIHAPATTYFPSEWKGQTPKAKTGEDYIIETRIRSRLDPVELAVAELAAREGKSKSHNMWDAVGIGLHHLGRFARKRVIPVTP